jgi:hypothetical protein
LQQDIQRLENKADDLKRDLRLHLPKSLFMPVSRSDILDLLNVQDKLANNASEIATLVLHRKMIFPSTITDYFMEFLKRNIEASKQANVAIHELDELLETGFSGNEIKHVESMIKKLLDIEYDTDNQEIHLRHLLFDLEAGLPPVHAMFLYKIIEWTGDLSDQACEVGDRLQILLAR